MDWNIEYRLGNRFLFKERFMYTVRPTPNGSIVQCR